MEFEKITMHRIDPPVTLYVTDGKVCWPNHYNPDGHCMTVPEWNAWTEKVDRTLEDCGLKTKPKPQGTKTYGGHPFLIKNLDAINSRKRGYIKQAPRFLRRFYDGIVTKDRYESDV